MNQEENVENSEQVINLESNLGSRMETANITQIKFKFTGVDIFFMICIGIGIVLAGVCLNPDNCDGITALGLTGVFLIVAGFMPYVIILLLSLVERCLRK